jgi:hypothetical protein
MAFNPTPLSADQVEYLVQRFLTWKLPPNFNPDGGISASRPNYGPNVAWEPTGTNLLDYEQAKAMVMHMAEGMPVAERVVS